MSSIDSIVIGSGIGGLACAAALTRTGHRVLLLEQHAVAGGLTQTFSRDGFTWNVGMHYLGDMDPDGAGRGVLDWLCDGAVHMAPTGPVYDTVHFPDGFELQFSRPEAALKLDLTERFPASAGEIESFFMHLSEAADAGRAIFTQRALPPLLGKLHGLWHGAAVRRWWGRTASDVVAGSIGDHRLRAVLLAQRGDYGDPSGASCFGIHAVVMSHYLDGAYYPVGGAAAFADALVPVIRSRGEVRLNARVDALLVDDGEVCGVRLQDGTEIPCERVFSDAGALNTVGRLLPAALRASPWAREVLSFKPSVCHVGLYLGFEGDIRASGATASNHWFYDSWDMDAGAWSDPAAQSLPPGMFVSFPSLKDPHHEPGPSLRHTAEIVVMTHWHVFAQWADTAAGRRPEGYAAFKEMLEARVFEAFARAFPALAPMVVTRVLSTPLSTVAFTGAREGAIYGLETTPRRFMSDALRARTPVPGLYLTGQDVTTPGVVGAMMGGLLAAASVEPRVLPHLA